MSDQAQQQQFAAWLQDGEQPPPIPGVDPARVAVHRNTFVGTLVESLVESFPVTRALAGGGFFDAMARERVLSEPPRSPVLTEYALGFPAFVFGFPPAQSTPVLAEMAQLEALRMRAFHAADTKAIPPARFHRLACDAQLLGRTGARLHPAAHWLPARHPVLDLWRLHDQAIDPDAVDLRQLDAGQAQDVLVHRAQYALRMRLLPPGAVVLLDALAAGCSFAEAFSEAVQADPLAEPAALFSLLLHDELVADLIEISEEHA